MAPEVSKLSKYLVDERHSKLGHIVVDGNKKKNQILTSYQLILIGDFVYQINAHHMKKLIFKQKLMVGLIYNNKNNKTQIKPCLCISFNALEKYFL